MRLGHPPDCTCPIYTDSPGIARLNRQRTEALKEWPKRVIAPSRHAATHAAKDERTRCGFLILGTDVERPGCSTVSCTPCLAPNAAATAKVDGRRVGARRSAKLAPEYLSTWATIRQQRAFAAAVTDREPVAVARALRSLGLTTEHHALVLDLLDQLEKGG
ncbi:hypothetical protein GCM10009665_06280 [Kitasatospora nipponensis]|uniref:Uncharacterized protein n=1 Tax=Kitasatospora nipponensis TaxID=258049 RepID=A0ABN1VPM8_9ACTN